ncbi:beta-agarase-like [Haliotis rufescens]|uniref:beta-agarase-like n=1 Tax=Haliotis rufescens TaxID=6454 RepID=UPI00201F89A1|nr:beta-agarase-like [Haliotis rufescens]
MLPLSALVSAVLLHQGFSDTTVTIYNEWLSQGGRVHYEADRWNKHNGLTRTNLIPKCKAIGTASGRWINGDVNIFKNWPQSPSHHGYPDPSYLQNHAKQTQTWNYWMEQVHGYGSQVDNMVWETKSLFWPSWIDKSHHQGKFPNNLDAVGEFVSLMVQSAKDYSGGHMPKIFEVINEPEVEHFIDEQTLLDLHKTVAQKLKSRFGIKVGGPTYTGYTILKSDINNFGIWKRTARFLDMSLDHLDFFSFHAYNHIYVSGGSHHYSGINEARLVAGIDMIENYSHQKKGRNVPIIISEYGRGGTHGIDQWAHSGFLDFQTIYQPNGFMFTYLNLREFIDRAIVFILANEQYTGHTSLNWSLFTKDGHPTQMVKFFQFWHNFNYDQKFLKFGSQFTGTERVVSPLALANPTNKELVVLLHNYGTAWQNVKLDFHGGWINPTTGESTCVKYENGNPAMHSNVHFDTTKNHGNVGLPGESTCFYKFKTNHNFGSLRTNNENTYYGNNMIIPISNGHAQTTIHLPSSGYHTAHLRVGVSRDKNANAKPLSVVLNGYTLPSTYTLFDADKIEASTKWQLWEYWVPVDHVKSTNTISMTFAGNGGHVTAVALVVGKLQ